MNTYNAIYSLNGEEVHKSVEASNIYKAKAAFASANMLPNEFFSGYENMTISISLDGREAAVMNYSDIKSLGQSSETPFNRL